jgi:hypothetical protein
MLVRVLLFLYSSGLCRYRETYARFCERHGLSKPDGAGPIERAFAWSVDRWRMERGSVFSVATSVNEGNQSFFFW